MKETIKRTCQKKPRHWSQMYTQLLETNITIYFYIHGFTGKEVRVTTGSTIL
jgi:hypothetical protein